VTEPIGILYEHPEWFRPLFETLDRRGVPYERIAAQEHRFDPAARSAPYSLVVNRVSPSSYLRGHTAAIFHARQYLAHLEEIGVPVVNGLRAHELETSKARQLTLLASLGLPFPRSRVVNHVSQIEPAAAELEYPLIVKPNVGGSGALMARFDTPSELALAVAAGELDGVFGLDWTAVVQEYHRPRGGSIVRMEALDGQVLYAIRIENDPDQGFNLCPADICQVDGAAPLANDLDFCPADAPAKKALEIRAVEPPGWVAEAVLEIVGAAGIDVGGVEYLESERDGKLYFYDVNALSNFVTDAPRVVGFDPFERFVEYLERRAGIRGAAGARVGRN
jgi:glutathione synthase/RimK-type ligase-like ATP-grasp enzyme